MKPLTTSSWILTKNGERIGLVSEVQNGINVIGKLEKKQYNSLDEFKSELKNVQFEELPNKSTDPDNPHSDDETKGCESSG